MKVAVVQFKAATDKAANLEKILEYISRASGRGAELVAFPEFMMLYTRSSQTAEELADLAEPIGGRFVSEIAKSARRNRIQVVGTFYEKSNTRHRVHDTSFLVSKSGRLLSIYRKIHLYDALGFRESDKMAAGSQIARPVRTTIGTVGMMICYDLRFPEMSRHLATAGSHVLVAPSAWVNGDMKEEHWLAINRTRAIENGCYVVSPDQTGNIYCGRSLVVDPFGKILLDMGYRQGMGYAEISMETLDRTRKSLPLLKNRRPEIY